MACWAEGMLRAPPSLAARHDPGISPANDQVGFRRYPTLALFQHIGAQADMYRVMARGRGLTLFLAALQDELTTVLSDRLAARVTPGDTPAVPPPLLAAMIVSMLITVIRTWIERGATMPADVVDRMFLTVAGPAMRAGLRPASD